MNGVVRVLAIAPLLLLAGCSEEPSGPIDIRFEHVDGCTVEQPDAQSGSLRADPAWESFWQEHCVGQRPEVDFDRQVVVYDAWGRQPSGGYSTELADVQADGEAMQARFVRTEPGPACGVTDALTYPTAVAVVDARRDATILSHGIQTDDCA